MKCLEILVEKPTFITPPEDQVVHDYHAALTKVLVHGVPLPKVEWLKDNKPIDVEATDKTTGEKIYRVSHKVVSSDQIESELEIIHFRMNDIAKVYTE